MSRLTLTIVMLSLAAACSTDDVNDRTLMRPDTTLTEDMGSDASEADPDGEMDPDDTGLVDMQMPDVSDGVCQPNRDGVIERSEVVVEAGLSARFGVARDETWDTAGQDVDGELLWDLAEPFASDQGVLVELRDPAGQWFEGTFPTADYFTPLSASSDLLGVFQTTDDAILLIGVVSPEDGLTATELEYDPPVPVMSFPLELGKQWSVESTVTGRFSGVISVYTETYAFEADETGTLLTPYGMFPTIRVRSVLDREVGLLTTVIRSFAFVSECFGTVATVAGQENESGAEFTDIAELRRLAP